uniref:Uncharacterized protein n=1 Tax=Setaria viridis TaxID=4556 RepID=A0A4U6UUI4_SETVI|nr:hypothetical protein SEVIR_4G071001v2 [Setaria viridis]
MVEWNFCGIRVVLECLLSSLDSVLGLLDPFLMLPELVTGAFGLRFVEEARGGARSRRLTADVLLPRTSCSYPKLGVRSWIWLGEFGGLILGYQPWRIGKQNRIFVPTKEKKNSRCSRDLVVILILLRVLSARKGCTVQPVIF